MIFKKIITSIFVFLQSFITTQAARKETYAEQDSWKKLQN